MNSLIKKFLNKETILYLIFGVLTTAVNIISYRICTISNIDYKIATIIAWCLSVAFAYITNKFFVFESKSFKFDILIKEILAFVVCRIFSGICDLAFMVFAVEIIGINDFISKIITNVFVVVINYIASKLFIFRKK